MSLVNGNLIIDVSEHQGTIDWNTIASNPKVSGVILRLGVGSDYRSQDDDYIKRNVSECKRLGIKIVGVYNYAYALNKTMGISEGKHALRLMQELGLGKDVIVFDDIEDVTVTGVARSIWEGFRDTVKAAGYKVGIYTGAYYFRSYLSGITGWDAFWVAAYGNNDDILDEWARPNFGVAYQLWQYSSAVKYAGIRGGLYGVDTSIVTDAATLNTVRGFKTTAKGSVSSKTATSSNAKKTSTNELIKQGQQHSINFTGHKIAVDGIAGPETKAQKVRVLQHAINIDYKEKLAEDGVWGKLSDQAFRNHYVKRGETQYLVTALEILLMLNGYDPHGVECPGIFGSLEDTVKQFQKDHGLVVDGWAGKQTFMALIK